MELCLKFFFDEDPRVLDDRRFSCYMEVVHLQVFRGVLICNHLLNESIIELKKFDDDYQEESELIWKILRRLYVLFETLQKVLSVCSQLRVFFLSQIDDLVLVYFPTDSFFFQTETVHFDRIF